MFYGVYFMDEYFLEIPHIPPMTIAIWCGTTKPTDLNEFFRQFVDELLLLLNEPIVINNHLITIKIRCFICDTPARAFIKGLYDFNHIFLASDNFMLFSILQFNGVRYRRSYQLPRLPEMYGRRKVLPYST